jgi:hypothetical protein
MTISGWRDALDSMRLPISALAVRNWRFALADENFAELRYAFGVGWAELDLHWPA